MEYKHYKKHANSNWGGVKYKIVGDIFVPPLEVLEDFEDYFNDPPWATLIEDDFE